MGAPKTPQSLRSAGDRDLAEVLLKDPELRRAIERAERQAEGSGARRQLLGMAIRLAPEMAPDVHAILDRCRSLLGLDAPVEIYVYPDSAFNAAAVRPERGRLFILLSAALLEAFEPEELRFVAGHEFGHHLFDHHRIPLQALLGGRARLSPGLVLQLFAWQRYAEISADRAGVFCAGGLPPAARALFKLASGLHGGRVKVSIDQFLAQVGELREEAERPEGAGGVPRGDWYATHPFSPLRLRAVDLFARSELMVRDGMARSDLEAQVEDLMTLMRPSYLQETTDVAEAMRRLLFAGGVLIAAASGEVKDEAIAALERLLGPGSVPPEIHVDAVRQDLPRRIDMVNRLVPPLRRAQVLRDLCLIARADGRTDRAERRVMEEIAAAIGVDPAMVEQTVRQAPACH